MTNSACLSERAFAVVVEYLNLHATFNRKINNDHSDLPIIREYFVSEGDSFNERITKIPGAGKKTIKEIKDWIAPQFLTISSKAGLRRNKKDYAIILALRLAGLSLSEVGNLYGVGAERVRQMEGKALRLSENGLNWTAEERVLKYLAKKRGEVK